MGFLWPRATPGWNLPETPTLILTRRARTGNEKIKRTSHACQAPGGRILDCYLSRPRPVETS